MGSPNGGSNNYGSLAGLTTAVNETNKRLRELKELLCAQSPTYIPYNKVRQQIVNYGAPVTIPANTVHSISYIVLSGQMNISIDGTTVIYPQGYSSTEEVTELIAVPYTFTAVDPTSSGIVITIYK